MLVVLLACVDYTLEGGLTASSGTGEPSPEPPGLLALTPAESDLGVVPVGSTADAVLTVSNLGEGWLELGAVRLDDAAGVFQVTGLQVAEIPPDASTELVVGFEPTGEGSFEAQVTVDSAEGPATALVRGSSGVPALTLEPALHDFGQVPLGDNPSVFLTLSSVGSQPATLRGLEYLTTGGELYLASTDGLAAGDVLAPGEQRLLIVAYRPTDLVPDEATLVIRSDDPANPDLAAVQEGVGREPYLDYPVEVVITADDAWEAYLDGVPLTGPNQAVWSRSDSTSTVLRSGDHVLAIHGYDLAQVINGVLALVRVDGVTTWASGSSGWLATSSAPSGSWWDLGYDDSAWSVATACANDTTWGTAFATEKAEGAAWMWWTSDCRDLGKAWFRLEFVLP